jgi:four helix bundle protein
MKESVLKTKSFAFAIRIVKMYKYLCEIKKEYILSKQVVRCGTAIAALIHEATYAQSKADFISKLSISLKECHETEFWIDLLNATEYIDAEVSLSMKDDVEELLKMLTSSIKTTKKNVANDKKSKQ